MKHKIKMNIFSLETTVNPRLSTPRVAYIQFQTHFFWGGEGAGGGNLIETEGLFEREEAYSI